MDVALLGGVAHRQRWRARKGHSLPDDFGGTFTITSLGVGRIAEKAAVYKGQLAVRKMMTLSLAFDHRITFLSLYGWEPHRHDGVPGFSERRIVFICESLADRSLLHKLGNKQSRKR